MIGLRPQARRGRRAPTSWSWRRRLSAVTPPASRRKPASQPMHRPTDKPASQQAKQPASQPANQPASRQARQPMSQPRSQPTLQQTDQPQRQLTLQPPRQSPSRPTSQSAGWAASQLRNSRPTVLVVRWELVENLLAVVTESACARPNAILLRPYLNQKTCI